MSDYGLPQNEYAEAMSIELATLLHAKLSELLGRNYEEKLNVRENALKQLRAEIGARTGTGDTKDKPISLANFLGEVGLTIEASTLSRYEKNGAKAPTLYLAAIAHRWNIPLDAIAYITSLERQRNKVMTDREKVLAGFLRRSIHDGTLPESPDVDLQHFVLNEWDNETFKERVPFTLNELRKAWEHLEYEGLVKIADDRVSLNFSTEMVFHLAIAQDWRTPAEDMRIRFGESNVKQWKTHTPDFFRRVQA